MTAQGDNQSVGFTREELDALEDAEVMIPINGDLYPDHERAHLLVSLAEKIAARLPPEGA